MQSSVSAKPLIIPAPASIPLSPSAFNQIKSCRTAAVICVMVASTPSVENLSPDPLIWTSGIEVRSIHCFSRGTGEDGSSQSALESAYYMARSTSKNPL